MALKGGVAQVAKDQVRILAESVVEIGAISEHDLVTKLNALAAKTYDDPAELAQAKATAHWLATQLKVAGKQVPAEALAKLGL
jgi:F0F1-type ATP synthase epsilon subunit